MNFFKKKSFIGLAIFVMFFSIGLFSCKQSNTAGENKYERKTKYTINFTARHATIKAKINGKTEELTSPAEVVEGTEIIFIGTAEEGYKITPDSWSGVRVKEENPNEAVLKVTSNEKIELKASIEAETPIKIKFDRTEQSITVRIVGENLNLIGCTEKNLTSDTETTLKVKPNTFEIGIKGNNITKIEIKGTKNLQHSMTALDVSKCGLSLTELTCQYHRLQSLNLEKNTALTKINCENSGLSSLKLGNNTVLAELNCHNNPLSTLNLEKHTGLTKLNCAWTKLSSLNLEKNTLLTELFCDGNKLSSLDLTKNTKLTKLECYRNELDALDLTKNTDLATLHCYENKLKSLDLKNNNKLIELFCARNKLGLLNLEQNTLLAQFNCDYNAITDLKLGENSSFTYLSCFNNKIKKANMIDILNTLAKSTNTDNKRAILYSDEDSCENYKFKRETIDDPLKKAFNAAEGKNWALQYMDSDYRRDFISIP